MTTCYAITFENLIKDYFIKVVESFYDSAEVRLNWYAASNCSFRLQYYPLHRRLLIKQCRPRNRISAENNKYLMGWSKFHHINKKIEHRSYGWSIYTQVIYIHTYASVIMRSTGTWFPLQNGSYGGRTYPRASTHKMHHTSHGRVMDFTLWEFWKKWSCYNELVLYRQQWHRGP